MKIRSKGVGRGWHGNSEAHAKAGQKGGLQRGINYRNKKGGKINGEN